MCGGTSLATSLANLVGGLSPRVRGNPAASPATCFVPGSIPACAGEPPQRRRTRCKSRVYPRVCGGTFLPARRWLRRVGLSPRVRGNLHQIAFIAVEPGSIPACAGEPSCVPRSRPIGPGLSPRVRGNPSDHLQAIVTKGSIPACAGEPFLLPAVT